MLFAGPVLEDEGDAAGHADALDSRRRKGKGGASGSLRKLPVQVGHDGVELLLRPLSARSIP